MKVGSLVVLVDDDWLSKGSHNAKLYPIKDKVYTIRNFEYKGMAILLEEIYNPKCPGDGVEYCFFTVRFREVLPPMAKEIEQLLEEPHYA